MKIGYGVAIVFHSAMLCLVVRDVTNLSVILSTDVCSLKEGEANNSCIWGENGNEPFKARIGFQSHDARCFMLLMVHAAWAPKSDTRHILHEECVYKTLLLTRSYRTQQVDSLLRPPLFFNVVHGGSRSGSTQAPLVASQDWGVRYFNFCVSKLCCPIEHTVWISDWRTKKAHSFQCRVPLMDARASSFFHLELY